MEAGKLRHRVTIQVATVTQDAFGAPSYSWATFLASVPMALEPLNGREMVTAGAQYPQVSTQGTMRWATGILPTMRVLSDDSETYAIRAVLPDATGRKSIVLMLEKGVTTDA